MIAMHSVATLDTQAKVSLMQEDARFEVADEEASAAYLAGIRQGTRMGHPYAKVPKVFLSNDCVFNCAYCVCRESNEGKRRYACSPRELAELSYRQARTGGRGIFLSSAIFQNPDYTQELIIRTLKILRRDLGYTGYIHAKVMPGADGELIAQAGRYANRLSVNIEVARSEGYRKIARNKNKHNILTPMAQISRMIEAAAEEKSLGRRFASSQTTQIMAGSTGENDHEILRLSGALYRRYGLKRVYYTSFHYTHRATGYEELAPVVTPPWRMHRLYQADRLMQLYGFTADEIAPPTQPFLTQGMDPKAAWALRNLHLFPVEVNRAAYEMLLRVPGIGVTSARRILAARRGCVLTHEGLRKLGVSLKRCCHFVTCAGRYAGRGCEDDRALFSLLADPPEQISMDSLLEVPAFQ